MARGAARRNVRGAGPCYIGRVTDHATRPAPGCAPASIVGAAPSTARGTLWIMLSACAFSTITIFTTIATRAGTSLPTLLALRYTIATVLLCFVSGGVARLRLPRARALPLLVLGGGAQSVMTYFELSALRYIPAATVAFLFYTYPVWVTLFAALRRTEPLDARRLLALTLSLGGIVVMVGAPGTAALHPTGALLALSAAVLYALYIPLLGTFQRVVPGSIIAVYVVAGAGIVYLVIGLATRSLTLTLAPQAWGAAVGLGVISTTIAITLFLRGLPVLGPVRTSIVSTVEPFCTAILGALVLAQPLTASTGAGGAMIAAAVLLLQRADRATRIE